jgi:hypothetical protein
MLQRRNPDAYAYEDSGDQLNRDASFRLGAKYSVWQSVTDVDRLGRRAELRGPWNWSHATYLPTH